MPFHTRRRVEFRDTDAAGIVHFSAFFPWMEAAEHEMLRSVGIAVLPHSESSSELAVTWPRVSSSCQYRAAARFEDWIKITVSVAKVGDSSVHYHFEFRRDDEAAELLAEGTIVVVCCHLGPGGGLEKVSIPAPVREKLTLLAA